MTDRIFMFAEVQSTQKTKIWLNGGISVRFP